VVEPLLEDVALCRIWSQYPALCHVESSTNRCKEMVHGSDLSQ
jgi:hypothetical protein